MTETEIESRRTDEVQHLSFNYYIGICGWCDCTRLCNDCMALGLIDHKPSAAAHNSHTLCPL
jgi:hypothetical protein